MIKIILSIIFVLVFFFYLRKQKIIMIDPSAKLMKNVTYYDTENIYQFKKKII
jgi:hypothetical protein